MKKRLNVNASIADISSAAQETLEGFDEIKINCSACFVSSKSRYLLSHGKVKINCSHIIDIGEIKEVEVLAINGAKKMSASFEAPAKPTICAINGGLIIEDSPKKSLDQYLQVIVNGGVLHPMSFDTSNFKVNGVLLPYPDGAKIIMDENFRLNNTFINAAVPGETYFVFRLPENLNNISDKDIQKAFKMSGLVATEPLDLELLKRKNIRFYTLWLTAAEENAEVLMELVDGALGNTIIPAGYKVMEGGTLDKLAVRRFGNRIYVEGDLKVYRENADALNQVEGLIVKGTAYIAEPLLDLFFEKCSDNGDIAVVKGEWVDVSNTEYVINAVLLEKMTDGATFFIDNSDVEIHEDVSPEQMKDRIHGIYMKNSTLVLGLNQRNALRTFQLDTRSSIDIRGQMEEKKPEPEPEYLETRINTTYYKL